MSHRVVLMDAKPAPRLGDGGEPLDLRNINAQAFGEITHHCRSQSLRLYHLTVVSLEGIEALRTVTELSLEWATKVVSLAPVFRMGWLRRLTVIDLPRLVDLEGIEALATLTGLRAGGGMWKAMRLPSARPLAGLRSLKRLELEQIRFADDDIRVLAELTRLRYLRLSNQFERAQVAFLAKRLNPRLETPLTASIEASLGCTRCGATALYMFTGRRMPFLCKSCDRARFEKLTAEFERLVEVS